MDEANSGVEQRAGKSHTSGAGGAWRQTADHRPARCIDTEPLRGEELVRECHSKGPRNFSYLLLGSTSAARSCHGGYFRCPELEYGTLCVPGGIIPTDSPSLWKLCSCTCFIFWLYQASITFYNLNTFNHIMHWCWIGCFCKIIVAFTLTTNVLSFILCWTDGILKPSYSTWWIYWYFKQWTTLGILHSKCPQYFS